MVVSKEMSVFLRSKFYLVCCAAAMSLLVLFGACTDSTDPIPGPEDLAFYYSPGFAVIDLYHGGGADFSVATSPSVPLVNQWILNGEVVGEELSFHYDAVQIGIDTLRVDSFYDSVNWNRTWYVKVLENNSTIPPVVSSVQLDHGVQAADVEISWNMITQSTFPIVEYQVAMSYQGMITPDNWSGATSLGSYPHLYNQVGFSVTYTESENGMQSGEMAWFAVRGLDEVGQMSDITQGFSILISSPWFIEGYVYGDDGETVPNVIIDYGCPNCRVNSDSEGHFILGPFPNVDVYDLVTHTDNSPGNGDPFDSYYDFTAQNIQYDPDGNYDLMLLARYGLDEGCESYDLEFMTYFRVMTSTFLPSPLRPNYKLFKWENYPVPVYIPPFINVDGLDYQSLCRETIGFWNTAMEGEYLVLVDTPEEAGIEFYFDNEGTLYSGRTYLTEPNDQQYRLGDIIPERILIYLWETISQASRVQEVAMHELGHALGLRTHTVCMGEGFLMVPNPSGILDNGPENAVHPDEKRVVRAVRNLPQGVDISAFDWQ